MQATDIDPDSSFLLTSYNPNHIKSDYYFCVNDPFEEVHAVPKMAANDPMLFDNALKDAIRGEPLIETTDENEYEDFLIPTTKMDKRSRSRE